MALMGKKACTGKMAYSGMLASEIIGSRHRNENLRVSFYSLESWNRFVFLEFWSKTAVDVNVWHSWDAWLFLYTEGTLDT